LVKKAAQEPRVLEREPDQHFDFFVLDAFSSDAIPAHLLTAEAFRVYVRHLRPGGMFAANISNLYLDLRPVLERAARALGQRAVFVESFPAGTGTSRAWWVLMSTDPALLNEATGIAKDVPLASRRGFRTWTDDYSNLLSVLRWSQQGG
jgi:spermidine synthase